MLADVKEAQCCIVIGPVDNPQIKFRFYLLAPSPTVDQLITDLGIPDRTAESCVSVLIPGLIAGLDYWNYTIECFGEWVSSVDAYMKDLEARGCGNHYPRTE
jgi:hypothetical protein